MRKCLTLLKQLTNKVQVRQVVVSQIKSIQLGMLDCNIYKGVEYVLNVLDFVQAEVLQIFHHLDVLDELEQFFFRDLNVFKLQRL